MRRLLMTLALAASAQVSLAEEAKPANMAKGSAPIKSISALAFGPEGTLFVGDPQSAMIIGIETNDTTPAGKDDVNVEKLEEKLSSLLGAATTSIAINDVKVNPASGNIFLAVTRTGAGGGSIIAKLTRDGKLSEFSTKNVVFSTVKIPNANEKSRTEAITSMAYVDGKVIVAGLSNEEFASTLRAMPYPFKEADKGTSVEMYHGAHGALETKSPIRTFTPYKIDGADYLVAAYTCTPLVKVAVADLKPGSKIKGTTVAELGNRNRPLDIIPYAKGGKNFLLLANSARGVMKIDTATISDVKPINARTGPAGLPYETIAELKGVMQLDKLDDARAVILVQDEKKSYTLKSIPLP